MISAITLSALARRWSHCDLRDLRMDALADMLAKTYRRARKRRTPALAGDTRAIHRWRRAIVDLDLQSGAFADSAPRFARIGKRAHKVRDLLGRVHDIDALSIFLAKIPDLDAEALASFGKVAEEERQKLIRKATRRTERLLKRKAAAWKDEAAALLYAAARTADAAAPTKDQQASV